MRTSVVGSVSIVSAQLSSIVQIGDSVAVFPRSEVLAVQRQAPQYHGGEAGFDSFPVFRQNIPEPLLDESWTFTVRNEDPSIQVGYLKIIGLSVSSVLQVGSNKIIDTESRTKYINQVPQEKEPDGL